MIRPRRRGRNMQSQVVFDERVAMLLLKYARMVVARGYIHNTLGNIAIRVAHPTFADGVVYTKPAEISLEELALEDVVITDVPTGALLHGVTTLGRTVSEAYHRLNTLTAEVRRTIMAEQLAALKGSDIRYLDQDSVDRLHRFADRVIYPSRSQAPGAPAGNA